MATQQNISIKLTYENVRKFSIKTEREPINQFRIM